MSVLFRTKRIFQASVSSTIFSSSSTQSKGMFTSKISLNCFRNVTKAARSSYYSWLLPSLSTVNQFHSNSFSQWGNSRIRSDPKNDYCFSNNNNHQYNSTRSRWTKAKKKRFARYERRQKMAEHGIPVPKPAGYIPLDTPVVNAKTIQERIQEAQKHDEIVAAELHKSVQEEQKNFVILRHHMSQTPMQDLKMSDRVRRLLELHNGNQREVVRAQKQLGMQLFQVREGDTGSSAVQVIALTTRIQQLQTHMNAHKKDKHSKRGMDALYVRRRKLLDYMERKDFESYRRVVKTLGLVRS